MFLLCLRCFILLLYSFELPQMMEFYYEDIASFTFSLWEIRGCHLGDNRFPVFRTFPLRLFSCFTSFFLPCSLLPPLLDFLISLPCFYLLPLSVCQLHCHLTILYSKFPQEGPASWLVSMRKRASHQLR